jgi:hypothetical protein
MECGNRMPLLEHQFIFTCEAFFPDMFFHCIHCTEQGQCLLSQCLVGGFRIEKFPKCMGHTAHHRDAGDFGIAVIHFCSVRLEIALIIRKYFLWHFMSVSSVIIEQHRLLERIIVDPVTTLLRSSFLVAVAQLYRSLSLSLLFFNGSDDGFVVHLHSDSHWPSSPDDALRIPVLAVWPLA